LRGAAGADGLLVEEAPAGEGLAGVGDDGLCAGERVDVAARLGGDAAHALEEVEAGALGLEDGGDGAFEIGEDGVLGDAVAVGVAPGEGAAGVDAAEDGLEDLAAREDEGGLGQEDALAALVGIKDGVGGGVSGGEVFGQCELDELLDQGCDHGGLLVGLWPVMGTVLPRGAVAMQGERRCVRRWDFGSREGLTIGVEGGIRHGPLRAGRCAGAG
jgi:hypothetical protein